MRPAVLTVVLLAACSSPEDRAARQRLLSRDETRRPAVPPFDRSRPEAALRTGAEEAAAHLGSFEWTATVGWAVTKGGDPPSRLHLSERHRVRQLLDGDFEVQSDLDPGQGPGSQSGKQVVYTGKMTYARSLYAPFGAFRERPTDRGRDARRYRDESFGVLADLVDLFGPALELRPAGDSTFLSHQARRYTFALSSSPAPSADRAATAADEDTRRRLAFLAGRRPIQASGECLLDAESGVPLKVTLRGAFQVKDDPQARAEVELAAQMRVLGAATPPVARPKDVLPDERKPQGVARALEAAGLKKRGEEGMGREEPAEESE